MRTKKQIQHYGKHYSVLIFEDKQANFRRRHLVERIRQNRHARILEIGCGIAPIAEEFNDFQQLTVVEPYAPYAKKMRQLGRKKSGITVLEGFLEEHVSTLQKQEFDYIILSGVLHEVDNPKALLKDVAKITKNAVVHVMVPNARSFHRLLAVEAGLIADVHTMSAVQKKLNQPWAFDMKMLHRLATGAGFRIVAEGYFAFKPFTHAQMAKMLTHKIINKKMLDALFGMSKYAPELGSEMFVELQMAKRTKRR